MIVESLLTKREGGRLHLAEKIGRDAIDRDVAFGHGCRFATVPTRADLEEILFSLRRRGEFCKLTPSS